MKFTLCDFMTKKIYKITLKNSLSKMSKLLYSLSYRKTKVVFLNNTDLSNPSH